MPTYQPDPRYFSAGNAFLGGLQQAQEDQRRNALLDLEQQQFGLQDRRQAMAEDEYMRSLQAQQAQGEQAQRNRAVYASLFEEAGLPSGLADTEGADELAQHLIEQKIAPQSSAAMPSDVQTAIWYQNASPEQRRAFDVTKRNPTAPQLMLVNGVPTLIERTPDRLGAQTPLSSQETEQSAAEARKAAEARGAAVGGAAGDRQAKEPMLGSLDYVAGELEKQIPETMTGGFMGVAGRAAPAFDYQDSARFDNLKEQLSTELRAIFRIPGEGTLSDQEQKQYGLQLPDRKYSESVNNQIIKDIRTRASLRVGKSPAASSQQGKSGPKRVKVDAEGNVIGD